VRASAHVAGKALQHRPEISALGRAHEGDSHVTGRRCSQLGVSVRELDLRIVARNHWHRARLSSQLSSRPTLSK
jgi:hypothetical protein